MVPDLTRLRNDIQVICHWHHRNPASSAHSLSSRYKNSI
jgi:hypothetical protein